MAAAVPLFLSVPGVLSWPRPSRWPPGPSSPRGRDQATALPSLRVRQAGVLWLSGVTAGTVARISSILLADSDQGTSAQVRLVL